MSGSFSQKSIEMEINIDGGGARLIRGLACEATIQKPGLPEKSTAQVKVWGLPYSDLVSLTTLSFLPMESQKNLITIRAGEEKGSMSQVFAGEIASAWADFNSSPDVVLQIEAQGGFYPQRISAPPVSVNGQAPAAELIAQQAGEMGYSFRNLGGSASVLNAVFYGSPLEKAISIAGQIGAELIVDDNELILLPGKGTRGGAGPLLSDKNGLAGYPTFNQDGISCRCLFRQDLELGGLVQVESIVPRASGAWKITKLSHQLAAYHPDSKNWFTSLEGQYVD